MLHFRKIKSPLGTAFQAFNSDKSLAYSLLQDRQHGRRKGYMPPGRSRPWQLVIQHATRLPGGPLVPDGLRPIVRREAMNSAPEGITFANAYEASRLPLGSFDRSVEAYETTLEDFPPA